MSVRPCLHDRLLTPCPAPTDPVGQSGPRGTGSVGDSVGEGYYSVIHLAVLLQCEAPSSALTHALRTDAHVRYVRTASSVSTTRTRSHTTHPRTQILKIAADSEDCSRTFLLSLPLSRPSLSPSPVPPLPPHAQTQLQESEAHSKKQQGELEAAVHKLDALTTVRDALVCVCVCVLWMYVCVRPLRPLETRWCVCVCVCACVCCGCMCACV